MYVSNKRVPHIGPPNADILIVGEAPGEDEELQGKPFVGRSGDLLNHLLNQVGIDRDSIRLANVCNYRPQANNYNFLNGTWQLQDSKKELHEYLTTAQHKVIIPMGSIALNFFTGQSSVSKWRGSVLRYDNSFVLPTFHPASCFRDGQNATIIDFDLRKALKVIKEGYTDPAHDFADDLSSSNIYEVLSLVSAAPFVSMDIESIRGTNHILCVGFAVSGSKAYCIRNRFPLGSGCDPALLQAIQLVVDSAKSVTFHNGLFDTEILQQYGIDFKDKYDYDTMYAQRVIAPELPIGLDFCTSIYTDEPYYKDEGKDNSPSYKQTLWEYNCKDCITTYQIRVAQEKIIYQDKYLEKTFKYQMSLVPVAKHLQESGMLLDKERVEYLKEKVEARVKKNQAFINSIAGEHVLITSPKQVQNFLYNKLGLPTRTNREGGATTNEDAVVSLMHYAKKEMESKKTTEKQQEWLFKLAALKLILLIRGDEKLLSSYLGVTCSPDGRVRSSYKISGTETGRWSCSNYIDGSGLNAQTLPRDSVEVTESGERSET